jgi:universal stress protein E
MQKLTSILVVVDRSAGDLPLLAKAIALARAFGAGLELFACDAMHEYELEHTYDAQGREGARQASELELRGYLQGLSDRVTAEKLAVSIDVASESPLYEGIVRKIIGSRPDLVLKSAVHDSASRHSALSANDWQLIRTCPAPLLLGRGRAWRVPPSFAAAVDVSEAETPGLGAMILHTAALLRAGCRGELEVLFGEGSEASAQDREVHASTLRRLAEDVQLDAGRIRFLTGDPLMELAAKAAKQHYDVLVLGALTHRTQQAAALVGTLTRQLMETLDSDFILIRPTSFVSPVPEPNQNARSAQAIKNAP